MAKKMRVKIWRNCCICGVGFFLYVWVYVFSCVCVRKDSRQFCLYECGFLFLVQTHCACLKTEAESSCSKCQLCISSWSHLLLSFDWVYIFCCSGEVDNFLSWNNKNIMNVIFFNESGEMVHIHIEMVKRNKALGNWLCEGLNHCFI